ncbi:MAG: STT3 domain-containing protein, partial [Halobacteriales archaeon]|nr:STT3 domain-containing protein [Halobacteriales archaeon]
MSGPSDRSDDLVGVLRSTLGRWDDWYPIPILATLVGFALWVRLQAIDRFLVDGRIYFTGNDAFYHFREVMYVVTHWPWTMPFDPWTYFPYGTSQGQFGTLFDQLIATAALIVGLGSPDTQTVASVHLVAPAVFGAATVLPIYAIGKRYGDRLTGLFAAAVLVLLPGTFLSRTTVGFTDHNSAEPFFQAVAVLGLLLAIHVVEQEKPVFELIVDRDWAGLRRPLIWSVLGGFAVFTYIWVWPPGIFLVGLIAVFFTLQLTGTFVRGRSPEHLAFSGVVMMGVLFVLLLQ